LDNFVSISSFVRHLERQAKLPARKGKKKRREKQRKKIRSDKKKKEKYAHNALGGFFFFFPLPHHSCYISRFARPFVPAALAI